MNERKVHKGVYILPNLFTTASLLAAFMCVIYSFKSDFQNAALAIFVSAFMDGLDGKVARLTNTQSQFGVEFDSLADVVAFGMAPAVLAWTWQLQSFGRLGIGIAFLFVACAALRLARFNVDVSITPKNFFIGLPTPAAGCTLAAFVLFYEYLPSFFVENLPIIILIICIFIPLLMISRVRYFSFKEFGFLKKHPFRVLVCAILFMVLLFSNPHFWAFTGFCMYLVGGIVYTYIYLPHRNNKLMKKIKHFSDEIVSNEDVKSNNSELIKPENSEN